MDAGGPDHAGRLRRHRPDQARQALNGVVHLAAHRGVVHRRQVALERGDGGLDRAVWPAHLPEAPGDAATQRRHVDVEEHAIAVEQEPFGARRAADDQHVRADRLHLLAQPPSAQLHGALEHAFHRRDLKTHAHLLGRRRKPAHRRHVLRRGARGDGDQRQRRRILELPSSTLHIFQLSSVPIRRLPIHLRDSALLDVRIK